MKTGSIGMYERRVRSVCGPDIRRIEEDPVVNEMPVTIMLNGEELVTLVCSPYEFELLATGFLVSEGLLREPGDLLEITSRPEQGVVWVTTRGVRNLDGFLKRNFASCCGKGRPALHFLNDYEQLCPIEHEVRFTVREVLQFASLLNEASEAFRLTGGVHEAALARHGGLVACFEDIGRHNALDRILGYAFRNAVDTSGMAVVLSGRIASEMLTKAARIGVPVIVSRSAPTALAIDLADQLGMTLVGFARNDRMSVYTHVRRITD
ncbi:MAG: formate dehydrogenase accessory sulfurtransferase FdhD [Spirochaetes bacterium]|nr:MAG: formate dehydrogenase accessory sulfurtransferase FdhD [Spirochaetota bacterium]